MSDPKFEKFKKKREKEEKSDWQKFRENIARRLKEHSKSKHQKPHK